MAKSITLYRVALGFMIAGIIGTFVGLASLTSASFVSCGYRYYDHCYILSIVGVVIAALAAIFLLVASILYCVFKSNVMRNQKLPGNIIATNMASPTMIYPANAFPNQGTGMYSNQGFVASPGGIQNNQGFVASPGGIYNNQGFVSNPMGMYSNQGFVANPATTSYVSPMTNAVFPVPSTQGAPPTSSGIENMIGN